MAKIMLVAETTNDNSDLLLTFPEAHNQIKKLAIQTRSGNSTKYNREAC